MIAAVMQPYFFPYIGYFQLMHAVDVFVLLDDVQYIRRGWVNRNRIRSNGEAIWLTLPVTKAPRELPIVQNRYVLGDSVVACRKRLEACYAKAPCRSEALPLVDELMRYADDNVAAFNRHSLVALARALGVSCRFLASSELSRPPGLRGEEKVLDICRGIGATGYINASGGRDLYDPGRFREAGIRLSFLRTSVPAADVAPEPVQLSIIDHLMLSGCQRTAALLERHELEP